MAAYGGGWNGSAFNKTHWNGPGSQYVVCAVGAATATGRLATVAQGNTIACTQGQATASGYWAKADHRGEWNSGAFNTTRWNGSGIQYDSGITSDTIACTQGQATASGYWAAISQTTTIQGGVGYAVAQGLQGTIVVPWFDRVLAILTGRKVRDPTTHLWRVYDSSGVEIADVGGVLQRGLHGWLLWTNAYGQFTAGRYALVECVAATTGLVGFNTNAIGITHVGVWAKAQCLVNSADVSSLAEYVNPVVRNGEAGVVRIFRPANLENAGTNTHCARVTPIATVTQLNYNSSIDKVTNMAQVAKA